MHLIELYKKKDFVFSIEIFSTQNSEGYGKTQNNFGKPLNLVPQIIFL
jgi:hypothetical protein